MIGGHGDTVEFQNRLKELQDLYLPFHTTCGQERKVNKTSKGKQKTTKYTTGRKNDVERLAALAKEGCKRN